MLLWAYNDAMPIFEQVMKTRENTLNIEVLLCFIAILHEITTKEHLYDSINTWYMHKSRFLGVIGNFKFVLFSKKIMVGGSIIQLKKVWPYGWIFFLSPIKMNWPDLKQFLHNNHSFSNLEEVITWNPSWFRMSIPILEWWSCHHR
jgi:hypothetical protein